MRVSDLTHGEKLFLDRKRRGETKVQAAARLGVPLWHVSEFESDKELGEGLRRPKVGLGKLEQSEVFRIHRRRSGKTVKVLAKKLGCSAEWFRRMERCEVDSSRLAELWK